MNHTLDTTDRTLMTMLVEKTLHKRFKEHCSYRGVTMTNVLHTAIKRFLSTSKPASTASKATIDDADSPLRFFHR